MIRYRAFPESETCNCNCTEETDDSDDETETDDPSAVYFPVPRFQA